MSARRSDYVHPGAGTGPVVPHLTDPNASHAQLPPRSGRYRLGVLGSMMNPPHLGHRAMADAVRSACGLDRIVVVPAGIPPHRRPPSVPARRRLLLAVRAFADLPHVVVSDTEVERGEDGEVGYAVETIEELRDEPTQLGMDDLVVEPWLIVGADQAPTLPTWHRWRDIARQACIAIVRRPDLLDDDELAAAVARLRTDGATVVVVDMPPVGISSTMVREHAARGDREAVARLVPAAIVEDVLATWGPG